MSVRRAAWTALVVAFVLTRFLQLEALPLFLDEALHVVWSSRVLEPGRLARHLNDGKLLQVYSFAVILPWANDAAWLARASSAVVGFLGLFCSYAIGGRLYGERVGWFAALAYLISPYALFYDRMALADIYVSSLSALCLLLTLRLLERPGALRSLAVALALACVALAKMTGVVTAAVPALAAIVLGRRSALRWLPLVYAAYALVVGWPVVHFARRAQVYAHVAEAFGTQEHTAPQPAGQLHERLRGELGWLLEYWTWPLFLAAVLGLALGLARRDRRSLLLGLLALLPVVAFAIVSGHIFPRYLTASIVPVALLAALSFDALWTRLHPALAAPLSLALLLPAAAFDARLLRDPRLAPLPVIERRQYLEGWGAGYGADEAARWIRAEARARGGLRVVLHSHSERTVHMLLRAYLLNVPRLQIVEVDLRDEQAMAALRDESRNRPTLVALAAPWETERERFPDTRRIFDESERVREFRRPEGEVALTVYRLAPRAR
jgi:4-amino-4-deoxy-L-arabinose transferase-like glycosyltransferase